MKALIFLADNTNLWLMFFFFFSVWFDLSRSFHYHFCPYFCHIMSNEINVFLSQPFIIRYWRKDELHDMFFWTYIKVVKDVVFKYFNLVNYMSLNIKECMVWWSHHIFIVKVIKFSLMYYFCLGFYFVMLTKGKLSNNGSGVSYYCVF